MSSFFNIYCDESCHLENDKQKSMVLGAIWSPKHKSKEISQRIREIKVKHKLKSNFEHLSFNNKHSINVTSLYYLSEISIIENKFEEANEFINKAYLVNHSDSIYKQVQRINSLMSANDTSEITEKNDLHNDLLKIFEIGRNKIKGLYDRKDYQGAISQTHLLIEVIKNLKGEELVKTELSQLFQDLAIFYSQQNNIEKAKESIERAVSLNPNTENIEIQKLINSK